jgi:hypothetical protein
MEIRTMDRTAALQALARQIEQATQEDLATLVPPGRDIELMAAECCTTSDTLLRALQIGSIIGALIDELDWPMKHKWACREVLGILADKEKDSFARLGRPTFIN